MLPLCLEIPASSLKKSKNFKQLCFATNFHPFPQCCTSFPPKVLGKVLNFIIRPYSEIMKVCLAKISTPPPPGARRVKWPRTPRNEVILGSLIVFEQRTK